MIKKLTKIFFFIAIIWPISGQAALLYLENSDSQAIVGRDLSLQIKLDTQGQDINALEGDLFLPAGLQVSNIYNNNSLVSLWVDEPINDNGQIHFSGIMPGGFIGSGNLFKIVVKFSVASAQDFYFNNLQAYLNDGSGTQTDITSQNISINFIVSEQEQGIEVKIRDNIAPENFVPIIKRLDQIEPGIFFLVFDTKDKNSGIDYYEVREGWGTYVLATSPYRLKNQNLGEDIFVKAVDKTGNERVVKVLAFYPKFWYQKYQFYGIIIFALVVIWLAHKKKLTYARKSNKNKK